MQQQISIRQATINDAAFIAQTVAMAIEDEKILRDYAGENYIQVFETIATAETTQYSYLNTLIAETEKGNILGAVIGYDGKKLSQLKQATLDIVKQLTALQPQISDEADKDEFYIDSLAVHPDNRNKKIGTKLLKAICKKATEEKHQKIGLLVDTSNIKAEKLYTSVGFRQVGYKCFFSHTMKHLQISKSDEAN